VAMQSAEWAAIGGGLLLGTTAAAVLPAFPSARGGETGASWTIAPSLSPTSAGFSARGVF